MTMSAMVDSLVDAGFNVEKTYDNHNKGYRFTISKGDKYTSAFFEYPADTSKAYCDARQREFIDFIINEWRKNHAQESSESRKALELGEAFHEGFRAGLKGYTVADMYPKSIFISTARQNGRAAFMEAFKRYLNSNNVPYVEISKGENNMAEHTIHIRPETASLSELSKTAAKFLSAYNNRPKLPGIKNVIFSGPCTIVLWEDGTKTVVRCEKDVLDPEKGLAMAIAKKALGTNKSGSNYYDIFKKWLPKDEEEENDG